MRWVYANERQVPMDLLGVVFRPVLSISSAKRFSSGCTPGRSHSAAPAYSSEQKALSCAKAAPPNARAQLGITATYWCASGHTHRVIGSSAKLRTTVSIARFVSSGVMVRTFTRSSMMLGASARGAVVVPSSCPSALSHLVRLRQTVLFFIQRSVIVASRTAKCGKTKIQSRRRGGSGFKGHGRARG